MDHPLDRMRHAGGDPPPGIAYVTPAPKVCLTSKSEGPQSCSGSILYDGIEGMTSLEMLSIDSANVYESSACRPLDSRRANFNWSASYSEWPGLVPSEIVPNRGFGLTSRSCRNSRWP